MAPDDRHPTPNLEGEVAFSRTIANHPHERLSDREGQVLRLLASGSSVSQAAERMRLSVKTISTYRSRVLAKMHLRTNDELAYYASRHGLVE